MTGLVIFILLLIVVYLLSQSSRTRFRLDRLEMEVAALGRKLAAPEATSPEPIQTAPDTSQTNTPSNNFGDLTLEEAPAVATSTPSPIPPSQGTAKSDIFDQAVAWCLSGNPVLKVGIVLLFFGAAFLLSYAAQHGYFPIKVRLAAVALGGLALFAGGWILRRRGHVLYGLSLEGGGIGILYLTIFAASRLYGFIPAALALALLAVLVALACALAVWQNARGLACLASVGGFLAPILLSTGQGSHVALFSYYALLNAGILAISWFRSWRELNLIGFCFTFGIGLIWGIFSYRATWFVSCELFLGLFFCMYLGISLLFASRKAPDLRGYIDAPLVFGLPVVTATIQAGLVHHIPYAMAISALGLGIFYIGLALALKSRFGGDRRQLVDAFMAIGAISASLSIPLAVDGWWTAAAWAWEGAGMVWLGARENRRGIGLFGLLLQAGAALAFLIDTVSRPAIPAAWPFIGHFFLGCALIASAALFSARLSWQEENEPGKNDLGLGLFYWALLWWYGGGLVDIYRWMTAGMAADVPVSAIGLSFMVVSSAILTLIARRSAWPLAAKTAVLALTTGLAAGAALRFSEAMRFSWLATACWLLWPLALALHYIQLYRYEHEARHGDGPRPNFLFVGHILAWWIMLLFAARDIFLLVGHIAGLSQAWPLAGGMLAPVLPLLALVLKRDWPWPVKRWPTVYQRPGLDMPLILAGIAVIYSWVFQTANPAPWPYIPLLNPLELAETAVVMLFFLRAARWGKIPVWLAPVLLFLLVNAVVARCFHFYTGIAYSFPALFASSAFQAALSILWTVLALAMTIVAVRQSSRPLWHCGAALLTLVVVKLMLVDLAGIGAIGRIVSFLAVGLLMLLIGFFAPRPPEDERKSE